ncbi:MULTISPECIES: AAA family ATPase [unclassified Actinomyces]|uniref:ATP-binding protein n=1 Tax=unclassified Actinomyces TaxID=2609248 RepID=UPI002016E593|nr:MULTISPECIES: AAA family ATPase [unclassified Actinomyces]MCL3777889.1 ATP-binding protein [Actinomyces sp. AC-20-1]MCL3789230.1 ATP-binding protein [Actinomyces sp. 187325]MCL3791583.1 ATP-binding protein [Actinomyces sp. 186855]MCL3793525.1 ATP-binding protein [Actinomyces sp. 217892]
MAREFPRLLQPRLRELLTGLAAISIEGARGVGKTWLARRHGGTFIPVDDPDERAQLSILGAHLVEQTHPPLVLDEWQRMPELWDRVRRAVDLDPAPGRFILTGSASPAQAPVHTGAGRIATMRMRPLSLTERGIETPTVSLASLLVGNSSETVGGATHVGLDQYVDEILRSGFPAIRELPPLAREAQLDSYLEQTALHDLADGTPRRARGLQDWMQAYAAGISTCATYDAINSLAGGRDGGPLASSTARTYRDILEAVWFLDPLPGWSPSENEFSRLTGMDKHQMCDPALAARLLGLGAASLLGVGRPSMTTPRGVPRRTRLLGPLFESLVIQSTQVYADLCGARVHHLRTKGGRQEIDIVVEGADRRVVAIEVKAGAAPRPGTTRHLTWLRDRLGDRLADAVVVTSGRRAYRDEDGIAVVPAALLGP